MIEFAGLSIFTGSMNDVVTRVSRWITSKKHAYVCVTGAHGIVESHNDPSVYTAHKEATLVVPDGMPLVFFARLARRLETERIYGPDLMTALLSEAEKKRWRVFFYGTTQETLRGLIYRARQKYPNLHVAGSLAPPFRALTEKETIRMVTAINAARPQLLFVGMSTPKQELWMHAFSTRLRPMVLIGVGAAFDFLAGTKRQAPRWIQHSGFEWLYRFSQEPKRLWKRAFITNSQFILVSIQNWCGDICRKTIGKIILLLLSLGFAILLLVFFDWMAYLLTERGLVPYYKPIRIQQAVDDNARIEDWRLVHRMKDEYFEPDSQRIWKPKTNTWRFNNDGFIGNYSLNQLKAFQQQGLCIIAAVGDSNTQGIENTSWPEELDRLSANTRLHVINAGVAGYSSFQGIYRLQEILKYIHPNVVLISFGWNDIAPGVGAADKNFLSYYFKPDLWLSRSRLYLVIKEAVRRKQSISSYAARVNQQEYQQNISLMIRMVQQSGGQPYVLTRPFNQNHIHTISLPLLEGGWRRYIPSYNEAAKETAFKNHVHVLDIEKWFFPEPRLFIDDAHFSEEGNKVAAKKIYDALHLDGVCSNQIGKK